MLVQHRKQPSNDEGSSPGYACVPVAGSRGGSHFWFAPSYANLMRTNVAARYKKSWLPGAGFHRGLQAFVSHRVLSTSAVTAITRQSCQSVNGDWMSTQKCELVHLTLFKHGAESFLAALDDAGIPHSPVRMYSSAPKNSGLVEAITALSDAMPWNAIAKVIIAWIDARKSREVIIYTEGGGSFHAKGYSASDVQKLLQISTNVAIIDTKPADEQ